MLRGRKGKDKVPSTRQSPEHNTKRHGFQTLIPSLSIAERGEAIKRRQVVAPPEDKNPKGPKDGDPKSTGSNKEDKTAPSFTSQEKEQSQEELSMHWCTL